MISQDQIAAVMDSTVYDTDGDKVGKVGQVYLDDETGSAEWVTVNTGMFGSKETFIPVAEASLSGADLTVPFDKDKVKGAPKVDADAGHITPEEESELYRYYGMSGNAQTSDVDVATMPGEQYTETPATTSTTTTAATGADDAMTLSREQLNVGTERRETGRAKLRKYIVTEDVTQTVPVSREEVVVEREPITDGGVSGAELSEDEQVVTLHEERPVVTKETVPVERVSLGTQTVTEDRTVTEQVAHEEVDVDGTKGTV